MSLTKFVSVILVAVCFISAASSHEERKTYTGYSLYRFTPVTRDQLEKSITFMRNNGAKYDFWMEPSSVNRSFDIMTSPEHREELLLAAQEIGLRGRFLIRDISKKISETSNMDIEPKSLSAASSRQWLDSRNFHQKYHSYKDIELKLNDVANNSASSMVIEEFGVSSEGRPLYVVKFSQDPSANKQLILIDAGHHAREWLSHSTALFLIDYLASKTERSKGVFPLVENFFPKAGKRSLDNWLSDYDIWIVPTVNPDGYEYSHRYDRMWRKNRKRTFNNQCVGVDLNRNYPFHWNEAGASQKPCDAIYAGPQALSELESRSLANLIYENRRRMVMYLSLHSYSQVMLSPYGYSAVPPPNYNDLARVAGKGQAAIRAIRNTVYDFGTAAGLLYPAAGGSDDYAYGIAGVPFVYTIELSPSARDFMTGFLAPPSEIIPVGSELVVGITAMIEEMNAMRKARGAPSEFESSH